MLGPIGHTISFMENWPPLVLYDLLVITPFPLAISYHPWPPWPTPRPLSLLVAWGVLSGFQGSMDPLANIRPLGPIPYIRGVLGHLGPYGLYGPWAIICGPWSMGPLGPFWPNPMRPKGAKGGSPLDPKARWVPSHKWAHLSQFLTMDPNPPILAKNPKDHLWPIFSHGLW
ncbi:hypothetical protein O181_013323 [Austropuccinia psidii MF-1]|uniref:Uncharacterized protein n=1 Tax=Austropuccinia psidii MF-1 TaxID=1389203 RepID=A0A9Q3BZ04_9BASI|nr:hypothetical protein [Austropuccinia psidii MF-1]